MQITKRMCRCENAQKRGLCSMVIAESLVEVLTTGVLEIIFLVIHQMYSAIFLKILLKSVKTSDVSECNFT